MIAPPPWRLTIHESLGSTQAVVRELAEAGEPAHLAVMARRQTQGRGRAGRSWQSPIGNLSLSLLLRPREPARDAGQWSLLAGVALTEVLALFVPEPARLRLKWPNDVLLDQAKVAGILVETGAEADRLAWVVIGVGVNLAHAPDVPDRPTACLADVTVAPGAEAFAAALLGRVSHWQDRRERDGFAAVHAAWMCYAPDRGSALVVRGRSEPIEGAFAGLAEDGSLLIQTQGRVRTVASGEV